MENLRREYEGAYGFMADATIPAIIAEMIAHSAKINRTIRLTLRGVTVNVHSGSNLDLIYRNWSRSLSGYIGKSVGPSPNPVLTDEEKASDARIKARNEAKAKIRRDAVEAKLLNAPGIELADEAGWQGLKDKVNKNGYSGVMVTYSERWARLMQAEIAKGKNLEDVADATSHEADLEGITPSIYGYAVVTLSHCWKHGEQLRRWHNIKTQIRNEGDEANESGGVLDPALPLYLGYGERSSGVNRAPREKS